MKVVKRWGVMTLVALLVLGTMGAALADDGETEETKEAPESGIHVPEYEWAKDLVSFVFYWGLAEDDPLVGCPLAVTGAPRSGSLFPIPGLAAESVECVKLNVAGPNGQVNHGSMVSAFVHWLKSEDGQLLLEAGELSGMPKGQLVKEVAHDSLGKGLFDLDDSLTEVAAEDDDGNGPPAWVLDKKAARGKKK